MIRCVRCEFRTDDDSEAEQHARESGHYRCVVCQWRFLATHEQQTCGICIGRVRADLADIVEAFALLEPVGTTALTLLGDGTMQRLFRQDETDSYKASAHPLAHGEGQPKPIRDELLSDPLPILPALMSWEDFIREHYPYVGKGKVDPTLSEVVDWLTVNLDSRLEIAQTFPGFDEFASQVRRHRSAMQHAAELVADPVEAPADCFECGEPLLRTYRAPARPIQGRRLGLKDEGLVDTWTCSGCRSEYDQTRYFLALRAKASSWVSVPLAAETAQRPVKTLRSWIRRLQVMAVCRVEDHSVQVWWPDVSDRAFRHAALDDERSA